MFYFEKKRLTPNLRSPYCNNWQKSQLYVIDSTHLMCSHNFFFDHFMSYFRFCLSFHIDRYKWIDVSSNRIISVAIQRDNDATKGPTKHLQVKIHRKTLKSEKILCFLSILTVSFTLLYPFARKNNQKKKMLQF